MTDPGATVFLSYRRDVSWALAHLVRNDLIAHGFDVFLDVHGIGSGEFERMLLDEIAQRTHFLLLVEPRSLDRLAEPDDWVRREIAHALRRNRNVVPLLANRGQLPPAIDLPHDIARLAGFSAVSVPHDYFPESMQKLRERFLRPTELVPAARPEPSASVDKKPEPGTGTQFPLLPPQLAAVRRGIGVDLSWTAVPGATVYLVVWDRAGSASAEVVYRGTALGCHDVALWGLFAQYRIRAERDSEIGPWSESVRPEKRQ